VVRVKNGGVLVIQKLQRKKTNNGSVHGAVCNKISKRYNKYMLKNNTYNIMMQLTEEHKSLWRIKNEYIKDAKGSKDILAFWKKMVIEKETHIQELQSFLKNELK